MAEQSYNLKYTGKEIDDLLDKANNMDSSAQVPVGGTSGQVLTKKSGTDFDAEWKTPGVALPTGGTAEQILTKNSATDGDASWKDAPIALPAGGDSGQVLTKNSSTSGDASWKTPATPSNPLPTGGTTGQVLAKSSNTDFDVTWADQTGGGGGSGDSDVVIAVYENNTLSKTYDELLAAINANKIVYVMSPGNTYTRYYSYQYTGNTGSGYGLVFTAPPKTSRSPYSIHIPFFAVESDNTITKNLSFTAGTLPAGGTTGQILRKKSRTNYETEWVDADISLLASANAGAHNAISRGKFLGNSVTEAQYVAISAGTFDDLYIGDYWTIGGVNYRIAAFDYYLNSGDTACTTHHVVLVPDTCLYNAPINGTNTTYGGYVGSAMYKSHLEQAKTTIKNAFSGHVLKHRIYLTNAVANGRSSGGAWCDSEVDLMCEQMVYGSGIFSPVSDGSNVPANYRVDKSQLPLFQHEPSRICNRAIWWFRDVITASSFAFVGIGNASYSDASNSLGVRPAFCIY